MEVQSKMVKIVKKTKMVVKPPRAPKQRPNGSAFGALSRIDTAPVAIGNTVHGSEPHVQNTKDGVLIKGRDFMFSPIGANIATWTCCGGMPLTPAAFANTTLANYMRMYAKFRFKGVVAHFITSSPTSAAGDIMFYYGKDRSSVFLNQTSSSLLGFVMSDPSTVIGPQWTNHSCRLMITDEWKLCDYGMHDGVEEYAAGELFLLKKTTTADAPGYVIFDYEIEFAGHQIQPRLLTFPLPRIAYHQTNLGCTALAVLTGQLANSPRGLGPTGNNLSGLAATVPGGNQSGDIYKVFIDLTNSNAAGWVNCTPSTELLARTAGNNTTLTIADGMTCYMIFSGTQFCLYCNATQSFDPSNADSGLAWGVNANVTFNVQCWMSYIGSLASPAMFPNY